MASRILTEKSTEAPGRSEAPEAEPAKRAGRLPEPPPPPAGLHSPPPALRPPPPPPSAALHSQPPPPSAVLHSQPPAPSPALLSPPPPPSAALHSQRSGTPSALRSPPPAPPASLRSLAHPAVASSRSPTALLPPPQPALATEEPERSTPRLGPDGRPWWESYFGPDYPLLYPEKTRESGELEVRSILAALALRPGARVIDVGCGAGRHSLALAKLGFRVTGIDRSADRLSAASIAREAEGVELDLRLADMRSLPLEGVAPADAVLSLFTSFGYFGDAENEQAARGMAASLAHGGRLLLDLNNRELLEEANGVRTWSARPGGYLLDEYGFDPNLRRFHGVRTLLLGGSERRFVFDHRAYSEQEIRGLLKRAGLRVLAVYGSLERTPFNHRAPRMVVLAEKP